MSALGERRELNRMTDESMTSVHDEPAKPKALKSAQNMAAPGDHPERMASKEGLHDEPGPRPSHGLKPEPSAPTEETPLPDSKTHEEVAHVRPSVGYESSDWEPRTVKIVLESAEKAADNMTTTTSFESVQLQNGNDVIHLALPETMTLIQLLDLVGKHLGLDYVYDPNTFGNRSVVVKLHGTAKGEMKIKDLYAVLETVLKSHGFAMIRRQGKLATIVPVDQSLDADPKFVNAQSDAIQAGNVVVTCLFELEHVAAASVQNLLQNMKLGVAISTLENAQLLLVTCYAHRMSRIEQLVSVLDRPGEPKECWFRCLRYTAASTLAEKLRTLAGELQGVPFEVAPAVGTSSVRQGTESESSKTSEPDGSGGFHSRRSVYLDTDERTNRLLMIGHAEQLSILEQLVEVLDVAQKDLRTPKVYDVKDEKVQALLTA